MVTCAFLFTVNIVYFASVWG